MHNDRRVGEEAWHKAHAEGFRVHERGDEAAPGNAGLFASARHFVIGLVAHLRTRLELLGVELAQEKLRLVGALALGVAALFLGLVAVSLGLVFAIALAWNTPWRMPVIAGLFAVSLIVCVVFLAMARRRLALGANLFRHSLVELTRDREQFDRMPVR